MAVPTIFILNYINQLGNTTNYFGPGNIPHGLGISFGSNFPIDSRLIPGLGLNSAQHSTFTVNPSFQGSPLFSANIPASTNPAFFGNQPYPLNPTIPVNPSYPGNPIFPVNIPALANPVFSGNPIFPANIPAPANPASLENQAYPLNPNIPLNPSSPGNPILPANIPAPANPASLENQAYPLNPNIPVNPSSPGNPILPANIPAPANPASLENQAYPLNPNIPVNPSSPGNPIFPTNIPVPANPVANVNPEFSLNTTIPGNPATQVNLTSTPTPPLTTDSTTKPSILTSPSIPTSTEPSSDIEASSIEPGPTITRTITLVRVTTSTTTTEPPDPEGVCLPQPGTCGQQNDDDTYESHNTGAKIDRNPWNVLLEYNTGFDETDYYCGGTLITNRYVITAASCVVDLPTGWSLIGVRLGEWDIDASTDCEDGVCADPSYDITIEKIIPHEEYIPNSRNFLHNIALLRLANRLRFTKYVSPICLPIAPHLRNVNYTGVGLEVAGWARSLAETSIRSKLRDVVNGITLEECNTLYNQRSVEIQDSQICLVDVDSDVTCTEDVGGPLTIKNEENTLTPFYYLAGIGSINVAPCDVSYPGVYTRVGSYIDWIENLVC